MTSAASATALERRVRGPAELFLEDGEEDPEREEEPESP